MWRLIFILLFLPLGMRYPAAPFNGRREAIVDCAPSRVGGGILPDATGRYAPAFPGWGYYHYPISTTNDSAQYYFDQGLSLYYGYHLAESLASFKEASLKDSNCVMTYWGQALAMGPYYNNTYFYKQPPEVLPVLDKMNLLAGNASARERDLASAMSRRYSTDTADSRRIALNRAYSERMKELVGTYPGDKDIKALYIDGVMIEHAWDLWDSKGAPKPWTPELLEYCDEILAADAYHPAALHYHIHLREASLHPETTLSSAEKLKDLMPGVAHMVHMASHSYQRTGLYARGVVVNDSAHAAQKRYDSMAGYLHLGSFVIHYHAVEAFCAMNGAMYGKAIQSANNCRKMPALTNRQIVPRTYLQYLYMMPVFTQVRMGKWQAILDQPAPDSRWVYAVLLDDFARGMAFVRTGDRVSARRCLDSLRIRIKDPALALRQRPANAPITGASIAEAILEGELLFADKKPEEAMAAFGRAIQLEDGMSYAEPKDWVLPARQFAGAWLLRSKRPVDAERLYRDDLVENPGNGWALLGLAQCMQAREVKGGSLRQDASAFRAMAREAFAKAEEMPPASVY